MKMTIKKDTFSQNKNDKETDTFPQLDKILDAQEPQSRLHSGEKEIVNGFLFFSYFCLHIFHHFTREGGSWRAPFHCDASGG